LIAPHFREYSLQKRWILKQDEYRRSLHARATKEALEKNQREYNKFKLTRWAEYRKAEDERMIVESIEQKKRAQTLFWISLFQLKV